MIVFSPQLGTEEQLAAHYKAALDSVAVINQTKPAGVSDADWADTVKRNVDHIKIVLEREAWTTQDLNVLRQAIKGK